MLNREKTEAYIAILKEELLLATGCTEPVAVAYGAARLRDILGRRPEQVDVAVSGNILKNVNSVIVPNTGGLKGIRAAVAAGIVAGDAKKGLQVISSVSLQRKGEIRDYMEETPMEIHCSESPCLLDICLTGYAGKDTGAVRIAGHHSNIVYEEKNGEILKEDRGGDMIKEESQEEGILNVEDIVAFADHIDTGRVSSLLDRQIACNMAIAEAGLNGDWGANIGRILLDSGGEIKDEAKAYAAAASDARMGGCELPVVIVTGSGNQGIAASVPVICYARHIHADLDRLYRALLVSNLVTVHQKTGIGRLSAYCGAVSAGCGAGAGIAYLSGGGLEAVSRTIINTLAILSGTICDGAKPSCAAKIASAVEAGILGWQMQVHGQQFSGGEGILAATVERTIANVGRLARQGMRRTDEVILDIMTGKPAV